MCGRSTRQPQGRPARRDDGFAAVELTILMTFLVVMLLLVVGLGRVTHGRQLIEQAGAAAARAAALDNAPGPAAADARTAARDTLAQAGLACRDLQVDVGTGAFYPGGYVDVTVRCTADLSRLALAGLPGAVQLTSTSRSVLETYRDLPSPARTRTDLPCRTPPCRTPSTSRAPTAAPPQLASRSGRAPVGLEALEVAATRALSRSSCRSWRSG